jgi:hypothetical protein
MCQKNQNRPIDPTTAQAEGVELIGSALRLNPFVALATALVVPLVRLFRRRPARPTASVRKMKLESYSYQPVPPAICPGRRLMAEAAPNAPRTHPEGSPGAAGRRPPAGIRRKGGDDHGQD